MFAAQLLINEAAMIMAEVGISCGFDFRGADEKEQLLVCSAESLIKSYALQPGYNQDTINGLYDSLNRWIEVRKTLAAKYNELIYGVLDLKPTGLSLYELIVIKSECIDLLMKHTATDDAWQAFIGCIRANTTSIHLCIDLRGYTKLAAILEDTMNAGDIEAVALPDLNISDCI